MFYLKIDEEEAELKTQGTKELIICEMALGISAIWLFIEDKYGADELEIFKEITRAVAEKYFSDANREITRKES